VHPCTFYVSRASATVSYVAVGFDRGSSQAIPDDEELRQRAFAYAALLGLSPSQLIAKAVIPQMCEYDESGQLARDKPCGHTIRLTRVLDGFEFPTGSPFNDLVEGFALTLGSHGVVRGFTLTWPELRRVEAEARAQTNDLIRLVRMRGAMVVPGEVGTDYFPLVRRLANASDVTIVGLTIFYGEGRFGQEPKGDQVPSEILPLVVMEAEANVQGANLRFQLCGPVLLSDIARVTSGKK